MSDEKTVKAPEIEPVEKKFQFPTEIIELPSKGLLYPKTIPYLLVNLK